jgi:CheY-like chemotaxis protein
MDAQKRILIIDDSEIDLMILEEILVQAGYKVTQASDGKEGMEIFRSQPFDLVITDMIMPEKLGIEVLLELNEDFPAAKVIAISAGDEFGLEIDLDMARKIDVPTISKPFKPEEILEVIRNILDNPG